MPEPLPLNENIYPEYTTLQESHLADPLDRDGLLSVTQTLVNRGAEGYAGRLRADAQYFLLVNVYHVFVMPVAIGQSDRLGSLLESIPSDISTIVAAGAQYTSEQGYDQRGAYISSHAIMEGWAKVWGELRITSAAIWGR